MAVDNVLEHGKDLDPKLFLAPTWSEVNSAEVLAEMSRWSIERQFP